MTINSSLRQSSFQFDYVIIWALVLSLIDYASLIVGISPLLAPFALVYRIMAAWTPVVFDFSEFNTTLHHLVLDSLEKAATTKRYHSRSNSRSWRTEVKEAINQHSDWEDMVCTQLILTQ